LDLSVLKPYHFTYTILALDASKSFLGRGFGSEIDERGAHRVNVRDVPTPFETPLSASHFGDGAPSS
jgi:hypothetical protein